MGRFDPKWPDAAKQAVGSAMLDPNPTSQRPLTGKQAVAQLNAGQLNCPAPPEPMPHRMAYECKKWEQKRRLGHTLSPAAKNWLEEPKQVEQNLTGRILSIHERNVEELERQRLKGTPDSRLFGMVVKNHREIMAAVRPPGRPHKPAGKQMPPKEPDKPDTVAILAQAHEDTKRGTNGTPSPAREPVAA